MIERKCAEDTMTIGKFEFIEYAETQWTPWFVHHFEPTVKHLAQQILEIFKEHSRARAIMEKARNAGQ